MHDTLLLVRLFVVLTCLRTKLWQSSFPLSFTRLVFSTLCALAGGMCNVISTLARHRLPRPLALPLVPLGQSEPRRAMAMHGPEQAASHHSRQSNEARTSTFCASRLLLHVFGGAAPQCRLPRCLPFSDRWAIHPSGGHRARLMAQNVAQNHIATNSSHADVFRLLSSSIILCAMLMRGEQLAILRPQLLWSGCWSAKPSGRQRVMSLGVELTHTARAMPLTIATNTVVYELCNSQVCAA